MITTESLEILARQYQTNVFPNIVREYFQHVFLSHLYRLSEAEQMLFKGGTALRIIYGSPRYSEDLDFSLFGVVPVQVKSFVEGLFVKVLAEIEQIGIDVEIGAKSNITSGGYFGAATFKLPEFPPAGVVLNVSSRRQGKIRGEVNSVAGDFVPIYTVFHLPQAALVEEKIFGALRERRKPRDFYDLYFLMRKGMLLPDQKKRLARMKKEIILHAKKIDFRRELGVFLPASQQAILRDFIRVLKTELDRQTGSSS